METALALQSSKAIRVRSWLGRVKQWRAPAVRMSRGQLWVRVQPLAELGLIGLWVMWVGRAFLDFNPMTWPTGNEWGIHLQPYHFWTQLQSCGLCALWNGGINGGAPALADVFGSTLHPLVMIPVLLWGVAVGAKVSVVAALWLAGAAQWGIARTLRLGWLARIWSALIAIMGGQLLAPMDVGEIAMVISVAAGSLTVAAALDLGVTGRRQATLRLALAGAMMIVAGHGYIQLGLLCWGPAFVFFVLDKQLKPRPVGKEFALAVGLSLLLAGVFVVPALHFLPNFTKPIDPEFVAAQTIEYSPLNLLIRDWQFMHTNILGKLPYPAPLFIGWLPVALAVICLRVARGRDHAALLCLGCGAALMFFVASAVPLRWFVTLIPGLAGFRHAILIAALAIPGVLGLSAYGLHYLWNMNWPRLTLQLTLNQTPIRVMPVLNLAWLLFIPLVGSLRVSYDYSQGFLATKNVETVYDIVDRLQSPGLQWVSLPFGEHWWVEPAMGRQLKLTDVVFPAGWSGRSSPERRLAVVHSDIPEGAQLIGTIGDLSVYQYSQVAYAYVDLGDGRVPCQATGSGGDLSVACSTDQVGRLVVQENSWTGWVASLDQSAVPLLPDRWLSVEAPAGTHEYRFRYLPWDVAVGFAATLAGILLMVRFRPRSNTAAWPLHSGAE